MVRIVAVVAVMLLLSVNVAVVNASQHEMDDMSMGSAMDATDESVDMALGSQTTEDDEAMMSEMAEETSSAADEIVYEGEDMSEDMGMDDATVEETDLDEPMSDVYESAL